MFVGDAEAVAHAGLGEHQSSVASRLPVTGKRGHERSGPRSTLEYDERLLAQREMSCGRETDWSRADDRTGRASKLVVGLLMSMLLVERDG